jgi:hypothetical protein
MPDSAPAYHEDFYAWTQAQAKALRKLPRGLIGDRLDIDHVAREIEELGTRNLHEVHAALQALFENLLKMKYFYKSVLALNWHDNARRQHDAAVGAFSPSMRSLIDMDRSWARGLESARRFFDEYEIEPAVPTHCPFALDAILAAPFDLDAALTRV